MNMPHGYKRLGRDVVVVDCSGIDFWTSLVICMLNNRGNRNLSGQFCGIGWFSGLITLTDARKIKHFPQHFADHIRYISFYIENQLVILFHYASNDWSSFVRGNYADREVLLMGSSDYALTKLRIAADIYMNTED